MSKGRREIPRKRTAGVIVSSLQYEKLRLAAQLEGCSVSSLLVPIVTKEIKKLAKKHGL